MSLFLEDLPNVINGKVLLAGLNNLLAQRIGLRSALRAFGRGQKKGTRGILSKLVNQDAKASGGITKASSGLLGGKLVDEEGAQGLVLAVGGIGGLEKSLAGIS